MNIIDEINNMIGLSGYPFLSAVIAVIIVAVFLISLFNIIAGIFKYVGGYN